MSLSPETGFGDAVTGRGVVSADGVTSAAHAPPAQNASDSAEAAAAAIPAVMPRRRIHDIKQTKRTPTSLPAAAIEGTASGY